MFKIFNRSNGYEKVSDDNYNDIKSEKNFCKIAKWIKKCNSKKQFKMVMKNIAYVNTKSIHQTTPLMMAAYYSNNDNGLNILKLILDYTDNINAVDSMGRNALYFAVRKANSTSSFEAVKMLIEHRIDTNTCDNNGLTPLMYFCDSHLDNYPITTAELLVQCGADVNRLSNSKLWTPLMLACRRALFDDTLITFLIFSGADINAKCIMGNTALMWMCINRHVSDCYTIMTLLLEYGADVTLVNNSGSTVLELLEHQTSDLAKDLKEKIKSINIYAKNQSS